MCDDSAFKIAIVRLQILSLEMFAIATVQRFDLACRLDRTKGESHSKQRGTVSFNSLSGNSNTAMQLGQTYLTDGFLHLFIESPKERWPKAYWVLSR